MGTPLRGWLQVPCSKNTHWQLLAGQVVPLPHFPSFSAATHTLWCGPPTPGFRMAPPCGVPVKPSLVCISVCR